MNDYQHVDYASKLVLAILIMALCLIIGFTGTVHVAANYGFRGNLVECCVCGGLRPYPTGYQRQAGVGYLTLEAFLAIAHIILAGLILDDVGYYHSFDPLLIYGTIIDVLILFCAGMGIIGLLAWGTWSCCIDVIALCQFVVKHSDSKVNHPDSNVPQSGDNAV
jgi:hypothetical protein